MKANGDVTEALQRTIGLVQGELERSVLSSQMLDASSASLRSTSSMHDTLSNVMGTSKQMITALEKSDWLDRLLILSGLTFFLLVILFILKQRILDRGLRIAFWWTRFLPKFSGDPDLITANKGGEVLSSAAAVTSGVLASLSPAFTPIPDVEQTVAPSLQVEESGSLDVIMSEYVTMSSTPELTVSSALDPSELADSGGHDEL